MAERPRDLFGQPIMQRLDQAADVVGDVGAIQVLPAAIPGVEDLSQVAQDVHDLTIAGQRAVAEVVDRAALVVRLDDSLRDRVQSAA